uniref:Agmatine deiminase family protein n=1 Tax=Roseihalotalea indica TaxID=2867963 RepID=A0AA49GL32_9BACT|nr:agmatine deiminase family protein [Tunicatimonas sp. TK19036]
MQYRRLLVLFFISVLSSCSPSEQSAIILPGEWEPQESIWLGWEHRPGVLGYHKAVFEIIRSVHEKVKVKIAAPTDSVAEIARRLIKQQHIPLTNIEFVTIKDNGYWIRDHGPTFVQDDFRQQWVVDFEWRNHSNELSQVDKKVAVLEGLEVMTAPVVNEGGGLESNGQGTILLVESMMVDRNPGKTKAEIEAVYREAVGAKKIIWLPQGLANDPWGLHHVADGYYGYGAGGHVDEFARFVNPNTIVLAWVGEEEKDAHPVLKQNYEVLRKAFQLLAQATDQDGKPFTIIKIPLPDIIIKKMVVAEQNAGISDTTLGIDLFEGERIPTVGDTVDFMAAASYNNFLITNGAVLLPTYIEAGSSEEKEQAVKAVFSSLFPDRQLIFIDCLYQNYRGGGIHCSTKQQPKILSTTP